MFEKIMDDIRNAGTIILHRHNNPDGDALGSQIGLWSLLKNAFPEKTVYKVGDGAGRYAFMKESRTFDEDLSADSNYAGWVNWGDRIRYYGRDGQMATGFQAFSSTVELWS